MGFKGVVSGLVAAVVLSGCMASGTGGFGEPRDAGDLTTSTAPSATDSSGPTPSASASSTAPTVPTEVPTPVVPEPTDDGTDRTALAVLAVLAVKGRAPMTGYDRNRFGQAWLDADRNGCDTRNDVLGELLTAIVLESNGCVVATGTYADPYTGQVIDYRRGDGTLIDIDHVVAMGNAWATGAAPWDIKKRAAFANDPLNLLPADAGANRQKADGDAATWLPSSRPFRCAYVARQVAVKEKYGLWVTTPEKEAIARVLGACPSEPVPVDRWAAPVRVDHDIVDPGAPVASPSSRPSPAPSAKPAPKPFAPVHYANCDAARAAGAAPVRRGDPGYASHLDRDGDGVGCE